MLIANGIIKLSGRCNLFNAYIILLMGLVFTRIWPTKKIGISFGAWITSKPKLAEIMSGKLGNMMCFIPCNKANNNNAFVDVFTNPKRDAAIATIKRMIMSIVRLSFVKLTTLTETKNIISVSGFNFIIPFTIPFMFI